MINRKVEVGDVWTNKAGDLLVCTFSKFSSDFGVRYNMCVFHKHNENYLVDENGIAEEKYVLYRYLGSIGYFLDQAILALVNENTVDRENGTYH